MAYDWTAEGEAAALKARRADLRAFSEAITELVAKMPLPETYLEAERGARAVWVADRVLVRMRVETLGGAEGLPSDGSPLRQPPLGAASATSPVRFATGEEGDNPPPPEAEGWTMPYLMTPVRLRLRNYADRLMEATARLEKPTCYLEAERAQRYALAADRMLGQLYEPVKAAKGAGSAGSLEEACDDAGYLEDGQPRPADDDLEAWYAILEGKLNQLAHRTAQGYGQWPNGAPYVEGEPEPEEASPFSVMEFIGADGKINETKRREIYAKARAWHAETSERGWETYAEAEKAEVIARIEADWDKGKLSPTSPHLRGEDGPKGQVRGWQPPGQTDTTPHPALRATFSPQVGRSEERVGRRESEGPSIRTVESIFAPSGPFGKRPCTCALSAPKCQGPCPLAP